MSAMEVGMVQIFDGTPGRGLAHIREYAQTTEELGFGSLWVPDHVVFFDSYDSKYPHTESGEIDFQDDQGILEPLMVLLAAVIAVAMKIVGVLLITALLIIPATTARRLTGGPEPMAFVAAFVGLLAVVGGLFGSLSVDTPAGPSIVVAALMLFIVSISPLGGLLRRALSKETG